MLQRWMHLETGAVQQCVARTGYSESGQSLADCFQKFNTNTFCKNVGRVKEWFNG